MLPYLKPKKQGTVIVANYEGGEMKPGYEEGEHSPGRMSAAEDLISAIHSKDALAVADALKAHHTMMDMETPDDEPMEE